MRFNICIVRPEGYLHSETFLELAELIVFGLTDLGHIASFAYNWIEPRSTNIIIGCHLLPIDLSNQIPASTIILNTEQIADTPEEWRLGILRWSEFFETWDYSSKNIDYFQALSLRPIKLLKIGFHPKLARIQSVADHDIDVLFYGSLNSRRKAILRELSTSNLRVRYLFGVYGDERDEIISRSKIVINMHNQSTEIFEIVRVFYLMTNRKAVIAEVNTTTSIDPLFSSGIIARPYESIVAECHHLAANEPDRRKAEDRALAAIMTLPQAELLAPLLE